MAARPVISGNEDELLRMQEEFYSGKLGPSSSLVGGQDESKMGRGFANMKPDSRSFSAQERTFIKPASETRKRQSLFAERRQATATSSEPSQKHAKLATAVLSDIVEKNTDHMKALPPKLDTATSSFPAVSKIDKQFMASRTAGKAKSLFAQQFAPNLAQSTPNITQIKPKVRFSVPETSQASILQGSAVVGESEVKQIHQENLNTLFSLTPEEKEEERRKLLGSLDPKLITFLQSKRVSASQHVIQEEQAENPEMGAELPQEEELIIPDVLVTDPNWVHMGKLEKEKLKWMGNIQEPKAPPLKGGYSARFDFQGTLLAYNSQLDVSKGLHHHGEEPERAGYTITELLHLSRSSLLQQRILALNTLSNILKMAKEGRYDECFEEPLLPTLLDSGLLFALRFALDDDANSAVFAAVIALKHLLVNESDEICLDRVLSWRRGDEQPSLPTDIDRDPAQRLQFEEDQSELKDVEMAQVDVIRACLRIDLLSRLRYILEVMEPPAMAVKAALDILIRIVRHSREGAEAVSRCPRLLDTVVGFYLPHLTAQPNGPFREALKLMRLLMAWDVDWSRSLLDRYPNILRAIVTYVTIDTSELQIPTQEGLLLGIESYHTLRVLLAYNLSISEFKSLQQILVRQLYYYAGNVSVGTEFEGETGIRYSHALGASFLRCLEAAVSITSVEKQGLQWGDIEYFMDPLYNCVIKWLKQCTTGIIKDSALGLISAALDLFTSFYIRLKNLRLPLLYVDLQKKLDDLKSTSLAFVESKSLSIALAKLGSYSVLLSNLKPGTQRDPSALPSLGSVTWGQPVSSILGPETPFPVLQAVLRLSNECILLKEVGKNLLKLPNVMNYLKKIPSSQTTLLNHWFSRFEVQTLFETVLLITAQEKSLGLGIALTALKHASAGDEWLVMRLMQEVIFQPETFENSEDLAPKLQDLSLETSTKDTASPNIDSAIETLKETGEAYRRLFFYGKDLTTSRNWYQRMSSLSTLTCLPSGSLLPADWPYFPILQLHHTVITKPGELKADSKEKLDRDAVLAALRWVTLLHAQGRFSGMDQSDTESAAYYCRLSCVFLASDSWFLDNDVAVYMWLLLKRLGQAPLNFEKPIPGIDSFPEFYGQLLDEYEAVSYGHPLFGAWILLPLQCRHAPSLRLAFWGQHSAILRNFPLLPSQVPASLESFLEPAETHQELLLFYSSALISGQLTRDRSPVLHVIAEQHVRQWVVRDPSQAMAHKLASFWSSKRAVNS